MGWYNDLQEKRLMGKVLAAAVVGALSWSAAGQAAPMEEDGLAAYDIGEMVVTAERMPTKLMDTPANISVVTAQEIEDNRYHDIFEVLSHENGVVVAHAGSFDSIRLNGDDRVVVLVDGRRLNNDQGLPSGKGSVDLRMIPSLKNIARIEIVRGGGSALYGADAVGGVVNIVTKKGLRQQTTIDVNAGSWGTYNYEAATEGSDERLSWFVAGGLQKRNHTNYKLNGVSAEAPHSDYDNNSAVVRLDHTLDDASSLRLDFEHRTKHDNTWFNAVNNTGFNDFRRDEIFNNVAVGYQFKEDQKTPGFFRFFNNQRSTTYGFSRFSTRLYGFDYQNGWQINGGHALIAGAEWHESRSTNRGSGYENRKIRNTAVYVQDTWQIDDKWTLVPGLRFDDHNRAGSHWTPKLAVNYRAEEGTQVYASWGRVFRAPSADDLFYTEDWGFGMGMYGNPNLRPETGHTATIGLRHQFDANTEIDFSLFHSDLRDAIAWQPLAGGTRWEAMNVNREKRRGLELAFKQRLSPIWSYELGYFYTNIRQTDASGAVAYYPRNPKPNGYRLGVHYQSGPWKANLFGTFASGMDRRFFSQRRYGLFDFNASYEIDEQATVYFKALNLTDQEYGEYPGSFSTFSGISSYYPGQGRFFQLGVAYTF